MFSPLKTDKTNDTGYILIDLAMVLVVMGVLLAAAIPFYQGYLQRNAMIQTEKRMDVLAKAFSNYIQVRWRLPCPAAPTVAAGAQLGIERGVVIGGAAVGSCTGGTANAHGIIPYRTLGIPEQYAKDGYGNFFTYIVSPDFTTDNRLGIAANNVHIRLVHLVGGNNHALLPRAQFCAPIIDTSSDITVTQTGTSMYTGIGGVRTIIVGDIVPRTAANIPNANLNRNPPVTGLAMAIISHGKNRFGAYQADGSQFPGAGGDEAATADNTNRIIQTQGVLSESVANPYDDIIQFYTQDEIFATAGGGSCEHL